MFKVACKPRKSSFFAVPEHAQNRLTKRCQICGNAFVPRNANAGICEFCKTPSHGILSGAVMAELSLTAVG